MILKCILFISVSPVVVNERPLPIITSRKLTYPYPYTQSKQAWLESLTTYEDEKLGMVDLHPLIFGMYPRCVCYLCVWSESSHFTRNLHLKTKLRGGAFNCWLWFLKVDKSDFYKHFNVFGKILLLQAYQFLSHSVSVNLYCLIYLFKEIYIYLYSLRYICLKAIYFAYIQ